IRFKGGAEPLKQGGRYCLREPDVPLESLMQRRMAEIRRADVRSREPAIALEKPGLGMEPRRPRLITDLDLYTERSQLVEGSCFRHPGIGCGDHADGHAAGSNLAQLVQKHPNAAPFHEGTEEVHTICLSEFSPQFASQSGFLL